MVPGRNFAKCPYVVNTGANDAYVRIRVMAPHDYEGSYRGFINAMFCSSATNSGEFQPEQTGWTGLSLKRTATPMRMA